MSLSFKEARKIYASICSNGGKMFRQDDIIVEIKRHRETLNAHYRGRAIGMATCLIGSQNYGVDTLDSDIDSLGIFVPAFYSLATNASCEWEKVFLIP